MATVPCTIVVFTDDKIKFPISWAFVVMKQLFQFGVKDISLKGDKIFISLSYSPKAQTLKRKFGTLPIRYIRAKIDNEDEFKIMEKVVKRYKFNLADDDDSPAAIQGGTKRKMIDCNNTTDSEYDNDDDNEEKQQEPFNLAEIEEFLGEDQSRSSTNSRKIKIKNSGGRKE